MIALKKRNRKFEGVGEWEKMDETIKYNEMQSLTLAAIRDALLPKLLSGEIRVREVEKVARQ